MKTPKNENKSGRVGDGFSSLIRVLFIAFILGGGVLCAVKYCGCVTPISVRPDYGKVCSGVRSLVEAQSNYYVHKSHGSFAKNMAELGYTREGGEVMLADVWKADWAKSPRVPDENQYCYTTFALDEGSRAVVVGVPALEGLPYFISLYGENGVAMYKARGTSVYRNANPKNFSEKFLAGETTLNKVREILKSSERVNAEGFSEKQ